MRFLYFLLLIGSWSTVYRSLSYSFLTVFSKSSYTCHLVNGLQAFSSLVTGNGIERRKKVGFIFRGQKKKRKKDFLWKLWFKRKRKNWLFWGEVNYVIRVSLSIGGRLELEPRRDMMEIFWPRDWWIVLRVHLVRWKIRRSKWVGCIKFFCVRVGWNFSLIIPAANSHSHWFCN